MHTRRLAPNALILLIALLVPAIAAAHDFEVDGIYYNKLDGNNVAVTYDESSISYTGYAGYNGDVTIPAKITYNFTEYNVTSIDYGAFFNCNLTRVSIPSSVTSIGVRAFQHCRYLTSVNIPSSVTSISKETFYDCYSLSSVTIPSSVTSIGSSAFSGCSSLASIDIPSSVTSIGSSAFSGCSSLASIDIPSSVTSIGEGVFRNCTSLTSVNIPNSVTSIGDQAFYNCSSLTSVNIPGSVTSIGCSAFHYCTSLTSIFIPSSVTFINIWAFICCPSLTCIDVDKNNSEYSSDDGVLFNKDKTVIIQCPAGKKGEYAIPSSVTSIDHRAFFGCAFLPSVNIPSSVTSIGNYAFVGCTSLSSVNIPSSVTYIGDWAFADCISLTDIICEVATPLPISSDVFDNVDKSACTLHVPAASLDLYKAADVWKDFYNFEAIADTEPGDLNGDGEVTIQDLNLLIELILGHNPEGVNPAAADLNGDGILTILDLNLLIMKIMG